MNFRSRLIGPLAGLALLGAVLASPVFAANATWNVDADGNWVDGGNWTPATAPGATTGTTNPDTATFGTAITAARAVTVDADRNIFGIDFAGNSSAYNLSGGNLLLSNGGFIRTSGGGSIHTDTIATPIAIQGDGGSAFLTGSSSTASRLLVISGNVSGVSTGVNNTTLTLNGTTTGNNAVNGIISNGSGGGTLSLVKSGTGLWNLNGANTFTGGFELNAGTIRLETTNDSFGAVGGAVTVTGNSTINFNSTNHTLQKSLQINGGVTLTTVKGGGGFADFTGVVSGSGTIRVNDAGTINQRPLVLSNSANTFTGAIDLFTNARSTITIASIGDTVGAGNIIFGTVNDSAFQLGTAAVAPLVLNNRVFEFRGGVSAGQINNNNTTAGNTMTINTDLSVTTAGAKTLRLGGANTGSNTFAGKIENGSGTVGVNKADAGKWILGNAANSYNGVTAISGGTLEVTKLGDGLSNSSIGASSNAASNLLIGSNGNTGVLRYTGSGDSTDRNFTINGTAAGNTATLDASGSGALNLTSTATPGYGTVDQTRTLNLRGTNTGDNMLAALIANNGTGAVSVTKDNGGVWVLSGDNTYTGTTTVTAGTLLINGNQTGNGAVTVAAAGTIGGIGTIGGATTLNGILSPGTSPGTLTFGNNLTVNNLSTYLFEAGDLTDVNGTLDLNDNWTLSVQGLGFQDGGTVTLFTYGTLAGSPDLNPTVILTGLGFTPSGPLTVTDNGSGSIILNGISIVPEPGTIALLGAGVAFLGFRLVRRRKV